MADAAATKQVVQRRDRRHAAVYDRFKTLLQQHLQPTLQSTVAVALCCILVFDRSVTFPLACLSGVFVVVLHVLLVRDHHVGTLLLSSAGLLGAVWLGVLTAGVLVTITLQARSHAVHLGLLVVLSSIVFGIFGIVKVTPLPFRLMLQGTNLMMTFGMSVILSLFAPTVHFLWSYFVSHMLLAFAAAALASCVSAIVVLPSFATEDAIEHVITALRKAGQTSTTCISILLRPESGGRSSGESYSRPAQRAAAVPAGSSSQPSVTQPASSSKLMSAVNLHRNSSLQVEDLSYLEAHPSTELHSFLHYTQPGVWGLQSFISAPSASSAAAARQQQQLAGHAAAAAAVTTIHKQVTDNDDDTFIREFAAAVDEDVVVDLHNMTTSSSSSDTGHQRSEIVQGSSDCDQIAQPPPATISKAMHVKSHRHLGLNLLTKISHHRPSHFHHHRRQQQQQQQSVLTQQQHLFIRLGRGVDLIRPLLLEARVMHEAVAVEQSWWVRLAVAGLPLVPAVTIESWSNLVNALEALLDRVAALEGMLEGGPDHASLTSLDSYATMRETCGIIFAQTAALCATLATALQCKLQQRQQHQLLYKLKSICCRGNRSQISDNRSSPRSSCPMLGICWQASKQQLLDVLHRETQCYFARLAAADQQRPFKLDPARAMVGLMFLSTLSLGVIEAAQKLQEAGQAIVYGKQAPPTPAAAPTASNASESGAAAETQTGTSSSSSMLQSTFPRVLLDCLLCVSVLRRLKVVLLQELPRNIRSITAFTAMLQGRRFQAGFKLWLVSTVAVTAAAVISVVWSGLPPNVLMFGFMAIAFTMKDRVESSTEMVIIRVGSTVVGAGLGHLLMFHPSLANQPWALTFILLFFAFVLPPFTGGQFRMMLCLLLITLNSMVLCQYIGCCDATGDLVYLLGRVIATGGGALFSMLVNRLILPWKRDRWALEEMSKVLGLAVTAAGVMYQREFDFVAEVTGHHPRMYRSSSSSSSSRDHVKITVLPQISDQQQQQQQQQAGHVRPHSPAAAETRATTSALPPAGTNANAQQQQQPQLHSADCIDTTRQQQQQPCIDPQHHLTAMQGLLAPVSLAVQRDTWMRWKWGSLAITPVVRLMLSAVQQLSDALAALRVTLSQICDITHPSNSLPAAHTAYHHHHHHQQQQQHLPGSSSSSSLIHLSDHSHAAADWRSVLLFDEFAGLVHGDIQQVLHELQLMVVMVQQQVRRPTAERQKALNRKIAEIHRLRIAISIRYVQLRNARHKNFRQRMAVQQQEQQQQDTNNRQPAAAAIYDSSATPTQSLQQQQQQHDVRSVSLSYHTSLQMDVATAQYMAFVYALRRVFNRALAVARCVADDDGSDDADDEAGFDLDHQDVDIELQQHSRKQPRA